MNLDLLFLEAVMLLLPRIFPTRLDAHEVRRSIGMTQIQPVLIAGRLA